MKLTAQQEQEIANIQQTRGLSRKSAVQYWRRNQKANDTKKVITHADGTPVTKAEVAARFEENGLPPAQPETASKPEPVAPKEAPAKQPEPADVAKANRKKKAVKRVKAAGYTSKPGRPSPVVVDQAKVLKMYADGKKVVDIAEAVGYKRTTGQNRIRTLLMAAGVYKGRGK